MLTAGLWGVVAFALSTSLTVLCIPLARRLGAVARPRQDRWHRKEIPLLGGIAIALATMVPLAAETFGTTGDPQRVVALLVGASMIAVVGLVDDLWNIRPQTKLLGQLLAATVAVGMGLRLSLTASPELDMLLTLLWIVAFTNAFNLLDNMDGLAAGIAAIAAAFRLGFFHLDGNVAGAASAAILLGATLGFLVHNRHPARIFMGDTGSMFIGFFVAGLSLVGGYPYSRGTLSILLLPVLVLLVPIFDTTFVTATRILAGRPISVGGRDHTSHRLVALGLSESRAVHLLYGLAAASGGISYLTYRYGLSRSAVLVLFLVLSVAMLALYLSRAQVQHPVPERDRPSFLRAVGRLSSLPQVAMVLIDFALIIAAYDAAYLLRFESDLGAMRAIFLQSVALVVGCQLVALMAHGAYQGLWRYTSLVDLVRVVRATTVGTLLAIAAIVLVFRFEGHSRSVFVLDWLLVTTFLCGSRVAFRLLGEMLRPARADARRILIYGAGDGGELAVREMLQNPALGRTPVAFLDDDPAKRRRRIRGVPVIGGAERIDELLAERAIDEVIVASAKIRAENVRRVASACAARAIPVVRAVDGPRSGRARGLAGRAADPRRARHPGPGDRRRRDGAGPPARGPRSRALRVAGRDAARRRRAGRACRARRARRVARHARQRALAAHDRAAARGAARLRARRRPGVDVPRQRRRLARRPAARRAARGRLEHPSITHAPRAPARADAARDPRRCAAVATRRSHRQQLRRERTPARGAGVRREPRRDHPERLRHRALPAVRGRPAWRCARPSASHPTRCWSA